MNDGDGLTALNKKAVEPTEMELRVARAVCAIVKPWMDGPDVPKSPCSCQKRETSYGTGTPICLLVNIDVARAAIRALREPTPDMTETILTLAAAPHSSASAVWERLIDSASPPQE